MGYRIAVDTGGTFTDVVVADGAGRLTVGKALTTPERTFEGFSEALANAGDIAGVPCERLLAENYCCGGGGGLNGIGLFREQRNVGLRKKRDQILATGAKLVIAPCHNCWDAIRDLEEEYEIGIRWTFLKPLLIKMLIIPDHLKPQDEDE